jgi:hypothetical protein
MPVPCDTRSSIEMSDRSPMASGPVEFL